jgi:hypothetical protein
MRPWSACIIRLVGFYCLATSFIDQSSAKATVKKMSLPRRNSELEYTTIPRAATSVPITGTATRRSSKTASLNAVRNHINGHLPNGGGHGGHQKPSSIPLVGAPLGLDYLVNITVGGQTFAVVIDTGSSNTWVPTTNFTCFNVTGGMVSQEECGFGPLFDIEASKTFVPIEDVNFNVTYGEMIFVGLVISSADRVLLGDGDIVLGGAAHETVTIGDITVHNQEIGVGENIFWVGNGVSMDMFFIVELSMCIFTQALVAVLSAWPSLT